MKTNATKSVKTRIVASAVAAACILSMAATAMPTTALANDGLSSPPHAKVSASHYEGEAVTIGTDWGQPVYAEWHRGASGKWWATFWTYNYTKVYAEPADAGCGWAFHVYDRNGNFVNVYRSEESSTHGQTGPQGVSSHWQDNNGNWY